MYAASADVLLSRQNLAASLNNVSDPGEITGDLNRVAQTQANLATAPTVLRLTLQRAGLPVSGIDELQTHSTVTAKPNADILTFRVEDGQANKAGDSPMRTLAATPITVGRSTVRESSAHWHASESASRIYGRNHPKTKA